MFPVFGQTCFVWKQNWDRVWIQTMKEQSPKTEFIWQKLSFIPVASCVIVGSTRTGGSTPQALPSKTSFSTIYFILLSSPLIEWCWLAVAPIGTNHTEKYWKVRWHSNLDILVSRMHKDMSQVPALTQAFCRVFADVSMLKPHGFSYRRSLKQTQRISRWGTYFGWSEPLPFFFVVKYGQIMSSPHLGEFIVTNICPIPLYNIEHTLNGS